MFWTLLMFLLKKTDAPFPERLPEKHHPGCYFFTPPAFLMAARTRSGVMGASVIWMPMAS